ncbi:MAG: TIGR03086 family metal-binding protein [Dehalococcoidia bacterium]
MTTDIRPIPPDPAGAYARALDATRRFVAAIPDGKWEVPTPCTEWDLRALVNHIVYGTIWIEDIFAGKTLADVGDKFDGDLLGDDALAAYDASVASAKAAISAPGAMETVCHISRGDVSGAEYATSMFTDVLIHGWDVAKAIGVDATLDPELVEVCYSLVEPRKERLRQSPAFGAGNNVEAPEEADLQTKLLAVLGRRA